MSLTDIGRKYGTDKVQHQFTDYYDSLFKTFRQERFNLLELGVFFGASIKMWNEYFPKATIYGADSFEGIQGNGNVFANPMEFYNEWLMNKPPNVVLNKVDQSSKNEIKQYVDRCKQQNLKFKVIIDDGSHLMFDQQISFFYLWDLLEDGGYFIIEDIHSSEQTGYDLNYKKTNSTKLLFMRMKYENESFRSIYIDDLDKCNEITKQIQNIDLHYTNSGSQSLLIRKR